MRNIQTLEQIQTFPCIVILWYENKQILVKKVSQCQASIPVFFVQDETTLAKMIVKRFPTVCECPAFFYMPSAKPEEQKWEKGTDPQKVLAEYTV